MIARILYRESIHGVVKYVFGKGKIRVLGYQNTYSETATGQEHFTRILHHLGNRHGTPKRYSHISLNLPYGEKLNDKSFYELSKSYMVNTGYGSQPYVVVRHFDTKHQHVHIISTTVKEDGSLINLSNDYRRNIAAQKYLEKQFDLTPSPDMKNKNGLPLYRLPELKRDDSQGVKFYIQDILNNTLQKHKVRSFEELAHLVESYHISVKTVKNRKDRIGVSYSVEIDNGYKSRFIDGYVVHPRLSGPKLQAIFERQSKSKLLPMHRKRLEKQLLTTFRLFKSISPQDLPGILKAYQKIEAKVLYDKKGAPIDFTILDKSGYVFSSSEINAELNFGENIVLNTSETGPKTELDSSSKQLTLEVRKIIKNAFYQSYLSSHKEKLLSECIINQDLRALFPLITTSDSFMFLNSYFQKDPNALMAIIKSEFKQTRTAIYERETNGEKEILLQKADLVKKVLDKKMFSLGEGQNISFNLLQSIGIKYARGRISYSNSNKYSVPCSIPNFRLPETMQPYISSGFIDQNEKALRALTNETPERELDLKGTSFFLPMIFPRLYNNMTPEYRIEFDKLSLRVFQVIAEKMHIPFEKSPEDYVRFFNAKGFYFVRKEKRLLMRSIYSDLSEGIALAPKTQMYLFAMDDLETTLENQKSVLEKIKDQGQDNLENLWVSFLIERKLYNKAAFMITNDGTRPNLSNEVLQYHMENGLREKIIQRTNKKIDLKHAILLRKSVFAFNALLGKTKYEEEVFNGFRDEFTDYEKYRSKPF